MRAPTREELLARERADVAARVVELRTKLEELEAQLAAATSGDRYQRGPGRRAGPLYAHVELTRALLRSAERRLDDYPVPTRDELAG